MNLYQFATALLILSASTGAAPSPGGGISKFHDDAPRTPLHELDMSSIDGQRVMHSESSFKSNGDQVMHTGSSLSCKSDDTVVSFEQAADEETFTLQEALMYTRMHDGASYLLEPSEEPMKGSIVENTPPRLHIARKVKGLLKKAETGKARIGPVSKVAKSQQGDAHLDINRI